MAQVGVVAGLILSQSAGALLLTGWAVACCVVWAAAAGSVRGKTLAGVLIACVIASPLVLWLISDKLTSSARSAKYRGLDFLLGEQSSAISDNEFAGINLLTLVPVHGLAVSLPILGAVTLLAMSRGVVVRICMLTAMAMMILIQPSHYHLAIWIALAFVAVESRQYSVLFVGTRHEEINDRIRWATGGRAEVTHD
jgi:hypothetical protein